MLNKFLGALTALFGLTCLIYSGSYVLSKGGYVEDYELLGLALLFVMGLVIGLFVYRIWPISKYIEENKIKNEIRLLELRIRHKKLQDEISADS